jgi:hypothetical protein
MLEDLLPFRERILKKQASLIPDIRWDGRKSKAGFLKAAATAPAA